MIDSLFRVINYVIIVMASGESEMEDVDDLVSLMDSYNEG